jgi:hypothetical protein
MRFHGKVGYASDTVEDPADSGIWKDIMTDQTYIGDVTRAVRQLEEADSVHDEPVPSHSISIVADPYSVEHFMKIKYVEWAGVRWTVTSVEVKPPRLILSLGDVYNGPLPEPEEP